MLASILCLIAAAAQAGAYAAQPDGKGRSLGRPFATSPQGTTTPLRPTLKWSKVSGASSYDLQIFQGNTLRRYFNGQRGTSRHVVYQLPANVHLMWRVRAKTAGSTGAWSMGMKFVISPPKPASPSGSIASATPTFRWNRLSGATRYQCSISGGGVQLTKSGLTTLSCTFGRALPTNVPLTWKVRGSNPDGKGVWSRGVAFIVVPDTPPLTITANDQSKTYGDTLSLGSTAFTTAGLLAGDSVTSVTLTSTGAAAAAPVSGSPYAIVPSAASGTGLDKYDMTYVNGGLTVGKKGLTISGARANDKIHQDGNTTATVDFSRASLNGVVGSDVVTIDSSAYSASFDNSSVGTGKPVTVTGVTLGGAGAGNYTVSQPSGLTADITIEPPLTIIADYQDKTYGDASLDSSDFSTEGLLAGDSVTSVTLTSTGAAATAPVSGSPYAIVPSAALGTGLGKYHINYVNGSLTVVKKGLTIGGASASSKVYDGTTTATIDFTGAGLIGVVGSDVVLIDSSACSASFGSRTVGTGRIVTVTGVTLGGAAAGNYTVSQPSGQSANITAKNLTISGAIARDKFQDGTTGATVDFTGASLIGVVGGDAVTIVSSGYAASFDNASTGTGKPVTGTGVTLGGADAGNYTVSQPSGLSADIAPLSTAVSSSTAPYAGRNNFASCYIPSGTTTGDLVFATVQARNRWLAVPPVVPEDSGWTKIGDYSYTGSISGTTNYFYYALYYLQVGATVPWHDRWDFSRTIDTISVTNVTYRGATYDTASIVPYTTDDTLLTAGSVTPAATGELLLFAGGAYDPSEIGTVKVSTAPAGFVTNVNVSSNSFTGYFALATAPQASAAASGTKTATLTTSTDLKHAWLIALRP